MDSVAVGFRMAGGQAAGILNSMPFGIGIWELVILMVVLLLVFGA